MRPSFFSNSIFEALMLHLMAESALSKIQNFNKAVES